MGFAGSDLNNILQIIMAISKDAMYVSVVENIKNVHRELLQAEAAGKRKQTSTLIKAMAKIDCYLELFQRDYERIAPKLTDEAKVVIEKYISDMKKQRSQLAYEKRVISRGDY